MYLSQRILHKLRFLLTPLLPPSSSPPPLPLSVHTPSQWQLPLIRETERCDMTNRYCRTHAVTLCTYQIRVGFFSLSVFRLTRREVFFPLISLCFFSPRSSAGFTLRRCHEMFYFFERLSFAWHHYESEGPRVTPNTFCNLSVSYLSYCTAQSRLPEQRPCRAAHIGKNRAVFLSACSDFSLYSLRLFCTVWLRRVTVTAEHVWFVCSIDEDLLCCFFCSD